MLSRLIKAGLRNLRKNSAFTLLNVAGLSISLCVVSILFLFIVHEKEFDRYNRSVSRLYRVLDHITVSQSKEIWCTSPNALAPAMKQAIPEINYAARVVRHDFGAPAIVRTDKESFKEKNFYYCDEDFLNLFDVPFEEGDPRTALIRPYTVIVSSTVAHKLFDHTAAVGKTILVDGKHLMRITGVFKDFPENSSFDCQIIGSFQSSGLGDNLTWDNASFETYCLLAENAQKAGVESTMQQLLKKSLPPPDPWFTINSITLQPFGEVHLYSDEYKNSYIARSGSIGEIKSFSLLAMLILLIACINYMNLATAQFQKRSKEIALHKVLGASTRTVLLRYYMETALLVLAALVAGLLLTSFSLPMFNFLTGKHIQFHHLLMPAFLIPLVLVWLITTLVAGSYPAISCAVQNPLSIMRSVRIRHSGAHFIRKGLVVLQITASIVLSVIALTIYGQLDFIRHKDLGYNPANVIALALPPSTGATTSALAVEELKKLPFVLGATTVQGFPGMTVSGRKLFKGGGDKLGLDIQTNNATGDVLNILKVRLLTGSPFPATIAAGDTTVRVILNKKALDYLGYTPEQAIGKKVNMMLGDNAYITGVADDFHFSSLQVPIGAYAFYTGGKQINNYILLRCAHGDQQMTGQLQNGFSKIFPLVLPDLTYLSAYVETLYVDQIRTGRIIFFFAILAIGIACLGLFGLAAYTAEQKTKEIGIRKVLGSSVINIVELLSAEYVSLFLIGCLVAIPIGLYLSTAWLENFAYRAKIDYMLLALTCLSLFLVALLTVSFQAMSAALRKPTQSLRRE
jgi:putative ABC transport system permease protein